MKQKRFFYVFLLLASLFLYPSITFSQTNNGLFYTDNDVPFIYPRSTWDNSPSLTSLMTWYPSASSTVPDYPPVERFIIHDTATPDNDPYDAITRIQGIYRYHAVTRGWGDIGYNYLIDQQGKIYEGRYGGNGIRAAHTYYDRAADNFNLGTIGISLLGTFAEQDASPAVYDSLARLIGWLAVDNNLDPSEMAKLSKIWNTNSGGYTSSYTGPVVAGHGDVEPGNPDPGMLDLAKVRTDAKKYYDKFKNYVYKAPDIEKIYSIKNGSRTGYSTIADLTSQQISYDKLAEITQTQLDLFAENRYQKYPDGTLLKIDAEPMVYLVDNAMRRPLQMTAKEFSALGFNLKNVRPVSGEDLSRYASSTPIKFTASNLLIRDTTTNKIYLTQNGRRRLFTSTSLFNALGYKTNKIKDLSHEEVIAYLEGSMMTYKTGTLAKTPTDSTVYLIDSGKKREFLSYETFTSLGYKIKNVITIGDEELGFYPSGIFVTLKNNTLVSAGDTKNLYIIQGSKKLPIISDDLLPILKLSRKNAITVSADEISHYTEGGSVKLATNTLFKKEGDGKIYVAKNGDKEWIPDMATFKKRKYKMSQVVTLKTAVFDKLYPTTQITATPATTGGQEISKVSTFNPLMRIAIYNVPDNTNVKITANGPYNFCPASSTCVEKPTNEITELINSGSNYPYGKFYGVASSTIIEIASYEDRPAWRPTINYNKFRGAIEIKYSDVSKKLWAVNELPLEDYLRGVAEALNADPAEYQKAFSIIARSYALFHQQNGGKYGPSEVFYLKNTGTDQVYKGYGFEVYANNLIKAIEATTGKIMTYNGKIARALYSSDSGGVTKDSCQVFGSYFCNADYNYLRGGAKDPDGTVHNDQKVAASHGVGMSAIGARKLAEQGKTAEEILKYYYSGIMIEQK